MRQKEKSIEPVNPEDFKRSDQFDQSFNMSENDDDEGDGGIDFYQTSCPSKLSRTFKTNSYLTQKLNFLKSEIPQLTDVDMMGFDQLQSLKLTGKSKMKQEMDFFEKDILDKSYYKWITKKYYRRRLDKEKAKEKVLVQNFHKKYQSYESINIP